MRYETDISLIITVVKKGWAERALQASIDAGAQGGTITYGRGVGIHDQATLMGLRIEPEKEVLFTAVRSEAEETVMEAIADAVELDKPGNGFSMSLPLSKVIGRPHMFTDPEEGEEQAPEE